jgi:hypothetical protein
MLARVQRYFQEDILGSMVFHVAMTLSEKNSDAFFGTQASFAANLTTLVGTILA